MSIYGTSLMLDDTHADGCAVWVTVQDEVREYGDRDCDCGLRNQPLVYAGSHVLPSDDDPRGGSLDLGVIPDFITRDGRDDGAEGDRKPWLRVGLTEDPSTHQGGQPGGATVVLTEAQARQVWESIGQWLSESCGSGDVTA